MEIVILLMNADSGRAIDKAVQRFEMERAFDSYQPIGRCNGNFHRHCENYDLVFLDSCACDRGTIKSTPYRWNSLRTEFDSHHRAALPPYLTSIYHPLTIFRHEGPARQRVTFVLPDYISYARSQSLQPLPSDGSIKAAL